MSEASAASAIMPPTTFLRKGLEGVEMLVKVGLPTWFVSESHAQWGRAKVGRYDVRSRVQFILWRLPTATAHLSSYRR